MSIILFLGSSVKEYIEKSAGMIQEHIQNGSLRCETCTKPMKHHSNYTRGIKETGEKIPITVVRCVTCPKWHALLPDFILPGKHYSGNEVESVIIDSAAVPIGEIETEASEPTVRRWISQTGEKLKQAAGALKYHFGRIGKAISETVITPGTAYSELEQILEKAPRAVKNSGNKLGLANIWLGATGIGAYI